MEKNGRRFKINSMTWPSPIHISCILCVILRYYSETIYISYWLTQNSKTVLGMHTIEEEHGHQSCFFSIPLQFRSFLCDSITLLTALNWILLLPSSTHIVHLFNSNNVFCWPKPFPIKFSLNGVCKHPSHTESSPYLKF